MSNIEILVQQFGLTQGVPVRIIADKQTAGIGQRRPNDNSRKTWVSSDGGAYISFVFPWEVRKLNKVSSLSLVAAAAVVCVLKENGLNPQFKWVSVSHNAFVAYILGSMCYVASWMKV